MAKPQLEDGYTSIANETLEHLMKLHLSPNQWQVLLCIFRLTYGYHKKVDSIANKQVMEDTLLGPTVVSRVLHDLEAMQLITRQGKRTGFQKDWEKWQKLAEQSTFVPEVSSPAVAQKVKTTTKETIQKKPYGEFQNVLLSDDEHEKLIGRFGVRVPEMIETLSQGIESKGYKYKSHYAALLSWERRERKQGGQRGQSRGAIRPPGAAAGGPPSRELPRRPGDYKTPEQTFRERDDNG